MISYFLKDEVPQTTFTIFFLFTKVSYKFQGFFQQKTEKQLAKPDELHYAKIHLQIHYCLNKANENVNIKYLLKVDRQTKSITFQLQKIESS